MRADVSVTIRSSDNAISSIRPNGVEICYGINMIPTMLLSLTPNDLFLLCDFESKRRKDITVFVDTIEGCLRFDGLVDGLSFSESVGEASAQLVVKSPFQMLTELSPRMPGFHSDGVDIFKRVETMEFKFVAPGKSLASEFLTAFQIGAIGQYGSVDVSQNIVKCIIEIVRAMLRSQEKVGITANVAPDMNNTIEFANKMGSVRILQCLAILERIDTSATDKMTFTGGNPQTQAMIMNSLQNAQGSIWDYLISTLGSIGVALVVGHNKAFTVPEVGFLKRPHENPLPFRYGSTAKVINTAYPSQYQNIVFNDNGYRDVKAVFVVNDPNVFGGNSAPKVNDLGFYIDPNIEIGGALTVSLPGFISFGLDAPYVGTTKAIRDRIKTQTTNYSTPISDKKLLSELTKNDQDIISDNLKYRRDFINQWAQLVYMRTKYMDRNGSVSCMFNPIWAPGAIGVIYTRQPGVYIDMFVSSVTHSFNVSAPNAGSATTNVNFACGRVGTNPEGSGLETVALYDYSFRDSNTFAQKFVNDTSS